jgi:2-dehydro-3-deoxyphosphogluconate aldolase/(4S)-4-hydroxy-2-oxoglutarate aldolase
MKFKNWLMGILPDESSDNRLVMNEETEMFEEYFTKLQAYGIFPVLKVDSADAAEKVAGALISGGLPIVEVTFRTQAAGEAIRRIHTAFPEMMLGAGTVTRVEQVKLAVDAGAGFIVSPGFNDAVVAYCVEKHIPVLPGCSNPSDIERALAYDLNTVKFFPAESSGGIAAIKAMAAPYATIKFVPTGGINEKNLFDYLSFDRILACGGSWMVPENLIHEEKFVEISALTKAAVRKSLDLSIGHIGINTENQTHAQELAFTFEKMFDITPKESTSSYMLKDFVEIMNGQGKGQFGHIAIATRSLPRARRLFEQMGFLFDENSLKYDSKGRPVAIYLASEIGGFAWHLLQK